MGEERDFYPVSALDIDAVPLPPEPTWEPSRQLFRSTEQLLTEEAALSTSEVIAIIAALVTLILVLVAVLVVLVAVVKHYRDGGSGTGRPAVRRVRGTNFLYRY